VDAGNYVLSGAEVSDLADITPATLTVTAVAEDKVYDGGVTATAALTAQVIGTDAVSATGTATFADKNVGDDKKVTVTGITLGGVDAGNYVLSGAEVSDLADITPATTTTKLESSKNPSTYGDAITFKATVANTDTSVIPVGKVQFKIDGSDFGSPVDMVSGVATSGSISSLIVPTHTINAVFIDAAGNFKTSSDTITQTVNKASTTTSVSSSKNPTIWGESVTFTAVVSTTSPEAGTLSGSVEFFDGGASLGTGTISGSTATLSTSALIVTSHTITAKYLGDTNFVDSTSSGITQVVDKATTTTAVTSSKSSIIIGEPVDFTATITVTPPGAGTVSGTVQFKDGLNNLGLPVTVTGGKATLTGVTTLSPGTHSITAVYSGDGNFKGSTSTNTVQIKVVYTFAGYTSPVDNWPTVNKANAGQAIPLKWRLSDANGKGISDPLSVDNVRSYPCLSDPGVPGDEIEEYAGNSGLIYKGDGYWQFNWKTPKSYARSCRIMYIDFNDGTTSPEAKFQFK